MEDVRRIHVHVHSVVFFQGFFGDEVLYGIDAEVVKDLAPVHAARKAAHAVVHRDDVRIERADQVIEGGKGGDGAASGNVYIHAEGRKRRFGVVFGVSVHGNVALVEVRNLRFARRGYHGKVGDEKGDRRALRLVVLPGNIQNARADHLCQGGQYFGKALGIVLLVDIRNIFLSFLCRLRVANVIDVEAERFCQVVEAVKL